MLLDWLTSHPAWLYSLLGVLGMLIGSFLNVVILRLPRMMQRGWQRDCAELLDCPVPADAEQESQLSLAYPPSHCPQCRSPIRPWNNIPVLSYLLLRGACPDCRNPISPRYPIVEALTGGATLYLGIVFGPSAMLVGAMVFTWALITLTGIDIDTQLLPDDITLPLLWVGLLFNLATGYVALSDAVIGAAAGYLSLWSIYWAFKLITGKEGMGYGDFKLLAAVGAWLGWQSLPLVILLSSLVGAVVGVLLIVLRRRGREVPIPFGPYLAMAAWITLLWGPALTESYLVALGP